MHSLERAHRELRFAHEAIHELRNAQNLDVAFAAWTEILQHLERVWNKAQAGMRDRPKWQGWPERGRINDKRSSDPLLAYLCNARGAEEHGIKDIADKQPGGIGINPARGNVIRNLSIRQDKERLEIRSDDPINITFRPGRLVLKAISNRGREYPVPAIHLGTPLAGVDPITLAETGAKYYADALALIEREFG